MPTYDLYNREEKAICTHLFRLLHENLNLNEKSPLGKFLDIIFKQDLDFRNDIPTLTNLNFDNITIYSETALIRDAYFSKMENLIELNRFMDDLTRVQ